MNRKYTLTIQYFLDTETVEKGKETVKATAELLGFKNFDVACVDQTRTQRQNNSLHLWLSQIEEHCNNLGLTTDCLFKNPGELPITRHMLKDFLRMTGNMMFGKKSTTELTKSEIDKVIKTCEFNFAKRLDSDIPFPSIEVLTDRDEL